MLAGVVMDGAAWATLASMTLVTIVMSLGMMIPPSWLHYIGAGGPGKAMICRSTSWLLREKRSQAVFARLASAAFGDEPGDQARGGDIEARVRGGGTRGGDFDCGKFPAWQTAGHL